MKLCSRLYPLVIVRLTGGHGGGAVVSGQDLFLRD